MPSVYYQPLIDLLVESVISPTEVSNSSLSLIFKLSSVMTALMFSIKLIHIYLNSTWFINPVLAFKWQRVMT